MCMFWLWHCAPCRPCDHLPHQGPPHSGFSERRHSTRQPWDERWEDQNSQTPVPQFSAFLEQPLMLVNTQGPCLNFLCPIVLLDSSAASSLPLYFSRGLWDAAITKHIQQIKGWSPNGSGVSHVLSTHPRTVSLCRGYSVMHVNERTSLPCFLQQNGSAVVQLSAPLEHAP